MNSKGYNAKDIEVLEGLDAVRMRPGMYIGTTGNKGLHHILWEIVDNAIDEAANGFATKVDVALYNDGSASVRDNGRGIPVDIHPKLKISGVEVVYTQLHAGGKFNNDNYAFSGGLHGVGASVTNALSRWLTVEVEKDGKIYRQEFHSPEEGGKVRSGVAKAPLKELGKTKNHGTFVRFLPDDRVFKSETFSYETIAKRLRELAFLNGGIEITLTDERDGKSTSFLFDGGLRDFAKYLNEGKNPLYNEPLFVEDKQDKFEFALAVQHTDDYTESMFSYVNNIPTTEGGTHETGMKSAWTRAFNEYARQRGFLKDKDENLIGDDFREGRTAVLIVKMQNIQFEGQTKTKLGNMDVKTNVENNLYVRLMEFLSKKANFAVGDKVVEKAMDAARVRIATRKAKALARQKNISTATVIGKLASCTGKNAALNELFIVEGDSAGGSAKQGRDRKFQAILPLRGKTLNAAKKRVEQILENEEMRALISALGAGFDDEFDLKNLKYDKVIILSDADQDGGHIRALLLTFFYRYMRQLITEGHVYMGMPPLYKVAKKGVVRYAYDDKELDEAIAEVGKGYTLQRYKGLGEMNPDQLWTTTMDPKNRKLVQVTIEDSAEASRMVSTLMGDNIEARKRYINEHADFNKVDKFADRI